MSESRLPVPIASTGMPDVSQRPVSSGRAADLRPLIREALAALVDIAPDLVRRGRWLRTRPPRERSSRWTAVEGDTVAELAFTELLRVRLDTNGRRLLVHRQQVWSVPLTLTEREAHIGRKVGLGLVIAGSILLFGALSRVTPYRPALPRTVRSRRQAYRVQ